MDKKQKTIPLWLALIPVLVLVFLIIFNVTWLDDDPLAGANQLALLLSSAIASALAVAYGTKFQTLIDGVIKTFSVSAISIVVLLCIGMIAGTWMLSGVIPAFIYYGLFILRPEYFLPAAMIISAIVSIATGSSWTTIATIGVAMLAIGSAMGINPAISAGAIISGAYFGDKLSPLSDTTILASSTAGIDIFEHIKYMMRTTVPTFIIALTIFTVMSIFGGVSDGDTTNVAAIQASLDSLFNLSPFVFIVPILVGFMVYKKVHSLPTLLGASIIAMVAAIILQPEHVGRIATSLTKTGEAGFLEKLIVLFRAAYGEIAVNTGDEAVDSLVSTGGMRGMLDTVWLIVMAMVFGGVMDASGFIHRITEAIVSKVQSTGSTIVAMVLSCILLNMSTADQYVTIVLSGKMYSQAFRRRGIAPEVLSRTMEDAGTVTSVLIPWNSCGATQAAVLGVPTLTYLPFTFFCILSPVVAITCALTGWGIKKTAPEAPDV